MPIKKFHRVEDIPMREPPTSEDRWKRIGQLWSLARRLHPRRWPAGVYKNRTIEEANQRRASWRNARPSPPFS